MKRLCVLIIEDSEDDTLLIERELKKQGYEPSYERVDTPEALMCALKEKPWDIILSDYSMPRISGLDAVRIVKERDPDLPVIVVTGAIGEELAASLMREGANDFILKGNLSRLVPAIERELQDAEVRRERKNAMEALWESEERYRQLFDNRSDAVMLFDADTLRVEDANPAALELFGYEKDEFIKLSPVDMSDMREKIYENIRKTGKYDARIRSEEHTFEKRGGAVFFGDISAGTYSYKGKKKVIVSIRDVTERKKAEKRIKAQLEKLSALRSIEMAIVSSLDLRVTLDMFLEQVIKQLSVDAANVMLLNPRLKILECVACRGFNTNIVKRMTLKLGDICAGQVALERRRIILPRIPEADRLFSVGKSHWSPQTNLLANEDFRAYFGVPLIAKGHVKGVLELFNRSAFDPDAEWLEFLDSLAAQAAVAIDNAIMFEDLQRSHSDLVMAYDTTIEGWAKALDYRDRETEGHSRRVTELTAGIACKMGIAEEELVHVRRGALLHDIGKLGVPDSVLLKPGKLDVEEWAAMRKHPEIAYELLYGIAYLRPAIEIPYCHHEKWDGTGYPRGLKGEQIPLGARIFAVVDVWDALSSDRPYRPAWAEDVICEHIRSLSGVHFCPDVVDAFFRKKDELAGAA